MTTFGSIGYRKQKPIKLRCRSCGEFFETYPALQQLRCAPCRKLTSGEKYARYCDEMRQRVTHQDKRR